MIPATSVVFRRAAPGPPGEPEHHAGLQRASKERHFYDFGSAQHAVSTELLSLGHSFRQALHVGLGR